MEQQIDGSLSLPFPLYEQKGLQVKKKKIGKSWGKKSKLKHLMSKRFNNYCHSGFSKSSMPSLYVPPQLSELKGYSTGKELEISPFLVVSEIYYR